MSTLKQQISTFERNVLIDALKNNDWNMTTTAKQLGISFRSMRYRVKRLSIKLHGQNLST